MELSAAAAAPLKAETAAARGEIPAGAAMAEPARMAMPATYSVVRILN